MDWKQEIEDCNRIIREGGTLLYPTDTVWGLGCDATNKEAVAKIGGVKKRHEKSYVILMESDGMLQRYVRYVPEVAWDLIDASEDPITIVYPEGYNLADGVCAKDGSVAVRITRDPFCQALIRKIRKPLLSTSANVSGESTPRNFEDISQPILDGVDYVVQHRRNEPTQSKPSSIIRLGLTGQVEIIRS
jgi:L-threonylcarbamoyladenylate synthase